MTSTFDLFYIVRTFSHHFPRLTLFLENVNAKQYAPSGRKTPIRQKHGLVAVTFHDGATHG